MKKNITTGELAKLANTTLRTIRYYDKIGLLPPSQVQENGYRMYCEDDFLKLQKIISLKHFGFSLDEIFPIIVNDDQFSFKKSLEMQLELVEKKINNLSLLKETLKSTATLIDSNEVNWDKISKLIQITNIEQHIIEQYRNSTNLNIRMQLHEKFSTSKEEWFRWLYNQIHTSSLCNLLEIGSGNGKLWTYAKKEEIEGVQICLSDISSGMVEDAKKLLNSNAFTYKVFDCQTIPFVDATFDAVVANHMLFYVNNIDTALLEIKRVLAKDGILYCSTYGVNHMKEIGELAKAFDSRITLSDINLVDVFGLENGKEILKKYFKKVEVHIHEDSLIVNEVQPLMDYILSCHGNQSEIIKDRHVEFKKFITRKLEASGSITITKEAGILKCYN